MRIEDYWEDGNLYVIVFNTLENQSISKIIVLPDNQTKYEIEKVIFSKFNKVKKIVSIDEWDTCLILK